MLKRVITAAVCLAIFLPILFFSGTVAGKAVFTGLIILLAFMAIYELAGCVGLRRKFTISVPSYLFVIFLMVFVVYFPKKPWTFMVSIAIAFLYIFITFCVSMLSSGNVRMGQTSELVAVSCYIAFGFLSIILLRYSETATLFGQNRAVLGNYLYMLIFLGAWSTDTGAYFVGVTMGKHKLIPGVSPNKTVEGAVGGVLGCLAGYSIYGGVLSIFFDVKVNWIALLILALVISVVDQFGDLVASYIKREQNIKDFGNVLPGHGGVLDRFDSIIAIAPCLYIITMLVPVAIFS